MTFIRNFLLTTTSKGIMKKNHFYGIIRIAMIFAFSCSISFTQAQPKTKRSGARIQKTNWSNSMGCTFADDICVALLEDDLLAFKLIVNFADPYIQDYPPMHFNYFFPNYHPLYPLFGYTDEVTPDMVYPVVLETGDSAWAAHFYFEIFLEDHCALYDNFFFKVEYQLVTPMGSGYMPYPVIAHPGLFPPDTFRIYQTGFAEYVKTDKEMCCDGQVHPCPPDVTTNSSASTRSTAADFTFRGFSSSDDQNIQEEEIEIFPNPTSTYVNIYLEESALKEDLQLAVYDASGRVMYQQNQFYQGEQSNAISTMDWPRGIYFFRFFSETQTIVKKVVK